MVPFWIAPNAVYNHVEAIRVTGVMHRMTIVIVEQKHTASITERYTTVYVG